MWIWQKGEVTKEKKKSLTIFFERKKESLHFVTKCDFVMSHFVIYTQNIVCFNAHKTGTESLRST